jgi:hypothetical protein
MYLPHPHFHHEGCKDMPWVSLSCAAHSSMLLLTALAILVPTSPFNRHRDGEHSSVILKLSCTSGSNMQTALCYFEAVRPKVPEILLDQPISCLSLRFSEGSNPSVTPDELLKAVCEDTIVVSDRFCVLAVYSLPLSFSHQNSHKANGIRIVLAPSYLDYHPVKSDVVNAHWDNPLIGASGSVRKCSCRLLLLFASPSYGLGASLPFFT